MRALYTSYTSFCKSFILAALFAALFVVVVVVSAAPGCTHGRAVVTLEGAADIPTEPKLAKKHYQRQLKAWSRSGKLYHHFEVQLFATATFHAPAFRRAFKAAYPQVYGHGGLLTRQALLEDSDVVAAAVGAADVAAADVAAATGAVGAMQADTATPSDVATDSGNMRPHSFLLTTYTPKRSSNNFTRADTVWRLLLSDLNGEVRVEPLEIVRVHSNINIFTLYPHVGRFDKNYLVRFPRHDAAGRPVIPPDSDGFILEIANAVGAITMRWRLNVPQQ